MQHLLRKVERASKSPVAVLIEGESDTGKETIGRAIHKNSSRRNKSFVHVDCSVNPDALDSIIFGNKVQGRKRPATPSKAVSAQGGVLYLSDIQYLPLETQAKLVRLIEAGEIASETGRAPRRVDVRVIASTSEKLLDLVKAKTFREDLFYRLNVMTLFIPPLRERTEDIPGLAEFLMMRYSAAEGRNIQRLDPAATQLLMSHDWPGNWRELQNVMFDAVQITEGTEITAVDLAKAAFSGTSDSSIFGNSAQFRQPASPQPDTTKSLSLIDQMGELRPLAELEADIIRFALDHYRSHMSEVSRRLGIGRSTLYRKLKELGIESGPEMAA